MVPGDFFEPGFSQDFAAGTASSTSCPTIFSGTLSQRVQFNASAEATNAFTVPLNPSFLDLQDSTEQTVTRSLDGAAVIQNSSFDARPYVLKWERIPGNTAGFFNMISTLKGYVGKAKYVKFYDIDYRTSGTGWTKVRVGNVKSTINKGGIIKYNLEVTLYPSQA